MMLDLTQNLSDDWWIDAVELDTIHTMSLDRDSKFWTSEFVPPPPRPEFLEEEITNDGVTTCDMCTWAWNYPSKIESLGGREFSWIITLIVVSLISALTGAIVMITIIKCKIRLKNAIHTSGICCCLQRDEEQNGTSIHLSNRSASRASSKELENDYQIPSERRERYNEVKRWSFFSKRPSTAPSQLGSLAPSAPDNHYTFEESYPNNGEALYAELDEDSSSTPAYQNTGFTESDAIPDCQLPSAPSSAYYSDLSNAPSDRTYETVCLPENDIVWDNRCFSSRKPPTNKKTITVPSDYI